MMGISDSMGIEMTGKTLAEVINDFTKHIREAVPFGAWDLPVNYLHAFHDRLGMSSLLPAY